MGRQAPEIAQLEPDSRPVYTPAYRASVREIVEMEKQVYEGIAAGSIRVSNSPYGSGVLFVVKPDGSFVHHPFVHHLPLIECTFGHEAAGQNAAGSRQLEEAAQVGKSKAK